MSDIPPTTRPPIVRATGPETRDQYLDRVARNIASGAQTFDDLRFIFDAGRPPGVPMGASAAADQTYLDRGLEGIRERVAQIIENRGAVPWVADAPKPPVESTDGWANLMALLRAYGLEELSGWVREQLISGASPAQIVLDLRNQPAFRRRFAAIFDREAAGLNPISPEEVLAYETQARQLMRAAGMPPGFWDEPSDFRRLIANDVSIAELADRINEGYLRVARADQTVRNAFASMFGPSGDAALAALFLDPERALPALQRQVGAAEFGGAGLRFGFTVDRDLALRASDLGLQSRASEGFATLHAIRGLFNETVTERQDLRAEREGVEAVFGISGESQEAVRRRQSTRLAAFAGDSGINVGQRGAAALGEVD